MNEVHLYARSSGLPEPVPPMNSPRPRGQWEGGSVVGLIETPGAGGLLRTYRTIGAADYALIALPSSGQDQ